MAEGVLPTFTIEGLMAVRINFRELREKLVFADVLAAYGVTVDADVGQYQGSCPLPTHQGAKDKPSFSANLGKKVWRCFGCKASGNVLDFAVRMEGLDPEQGNDVRTAALALMKHLKESDTDGVLPRLLEEARETYGASVKALYDDAGALVGFCIV